MTDFNWLLRKEGRKGGEGGKKVNPEERHDHRVPQLISRDVWLLPEWREIASSRTGTHVGAGEGQPRLKIKLFVFTVSSTFLWAFSEVRPEQQVSEQHCTDACSFSKKN